MTDIAAEPDAAPASHANRARMTAFAAVSAAVIIQAASFAFGTADLDGDNDSLMRLAMVRDLITGQGWFDPMQYRMGLEGGFSMHWSRLVDAPLAAIMLAVETFTGSQAAGEAAALLLWPSLLLAASIFLILRIATATYGDAAFLPALVTGAAALASSGIFAFGAIDHHNLQVTLTLAMLAALMRGGFVPAALAGFAAAVMAAVGAEALPYVAVGGVLAGGLWLVRGDDEAGTAKGFGIGLAAAAAACFVATVPQQAWLQPACDAYSIVQAGIAGPAGLGLAATTMLARRRGLATRLGAMIALGALLAAIVIAAFPQCLADPYGGLDPRLKLFWLDAVVEAQPAAEILARDPAMFAGWCATSLLALTELARRGWSGEWARGEIIVAAGLAMAVAVSIWQIRGALFAVPLAAIVLAGWIARARAAYAETGTGKALVRMTAAWALSFGATWGAVANAVAPDSGTRTAQQPAAAGASGSACELGEDYSYLASMTAGAVLAPSNLGSKILAFTPHRALSGPYHRNVAGNLAVLDMLLSTPEDAAALVEANGVKLVAFCPGDSETAFLMHAAPEGLLARLAAGDAPAWLRLASQPDAALIVYRVQ